MAEWEDLGTRIAALETSLSGAQGMAAAFDAELRQMNHTMALSGREADALSRSFGASLRRAFDGVVFGGEKLTDALRGLAQSMSQSFYAAAMRPVQNALGGAITQGVQGIVGGLLPFADGGSFAQGRVMPFAHGGIVSGPVAFPMRGGRTGLMGEAGPEAIMPLARGPDGRLGVQASGGGVGGGRPVNVTINIATPDVEGFRRSEAQIAAQMSRLLAHGQRNR